MNTKTVNGIELTRPEEPMNWQGVINGYRVEFIPYLGRYNRKINGWQAVSDENVLPEPRSPQNQALFHTSCATLTGCVERALEEL